MLSSGPGAHPLEAGQASRFAAERMAARGYTVLSIYGKMEHDFPTVPFADTVWPVKSALDYLEMSGYEDFVLEGQNYGAIVAAQYLATQPDLLIDNGGERRVKAVVLVNPTTNLTEALTRQPRRRFARGQSRPAYLQPADVDAVMMMLVALMSEVSALRDRIDTHEALAERGANATRDAVETYEIDTARHWVRESERQQMLKRVLRVITEERDAAATDGPGKPGVAA